MEEAVSLEMDNHVLDKEEGCYDNTEAAFSDDEEEVNNKGDEMGINQIKMVIPVETRMRLLYILLYIHNVRRTFYIGV